GRDPHTVRSRPFRGLGGRVVAGYVVLRLNQVSGHRSPHVSQSDNGDVRHRSFVSSGGALLSTQRRRCLPPLTMSRRTTPLNGQPSTAGVRICPSPPTAGRLAQVVQGGASIP